MIKEGSTWNPKKYQKNFTWALPKEIHLWKRSRYEKFVYHLCQRGRGMALPVLVMAGRGWLASTSVLVLDRCKREGGEGYPSQVLGLGYPTPPNQDQEGDEGGEGRGRGIPQSGPRTGITLLPPTPSPLPGHAMDRTQYGRYAFCVFTQ